MLYFSLTWNMKKLYKLSCFISQVLVTLVHVAEEIVWRRRHRSMLRLIVLIMTYVISRLSDPWGSKNESKNIVNIYFFIVTKFNIIYIYYIYIYNLYNIYGYYIKNFRKATIILNQIIISLYL